MPVYSVNGKVYDIPEDKVAGFEKKYPDATIEYHSEGKVYDIPLNKRNGFLQKNPNATFAPEKSQSLFSKSELGLDKSAWDKEPDEVVAPVFEKRPVSPLQMTEGEYMDRVQRGLDERKYDFSQMRTEQGITAGRQNVIKKDGRYYTPEGSFDSFLGATEAVDNAVEYNGVSVRQMKDYYSTDKDKQAEYAKSIGKTPEEIETAYETKTKSEIEGQMGDLFGRINKRMNDVNTQMTRMQNTHNGERSFGTAVKDAIMGASVAELPVLHGQIPASTLEITPEWQTLKKEDEQLWAAARQYNTAQKMISAAKSGEFGRGFGDAIDELILGGVAQDMQDLNAIKAVAEKFDKGEKLNESEEMLLESMAMNVAVASQYQDDISAWYNAGKMTGEMIPYMVEMWMNPLSKLGKKLGKEVVDRARKKYGKKLVEHKTGIAVKKGLANLGGATLGGYGMALTTGLPSVAVGVQERIMGDAMYRMDNGKVEYTGQSLGEGVGEAIYKETTQRMLDNASEMLGAGYLGKPFSWLRNAGKGTKLLGWIDNLAESKFGKAMNEFFEATNWHGPIEEFMEELHVGIASPFLTGEGEVKDFFEGKNLATTAIGVAVPGAAFATLATIQGAREGAFKAGAKERWRMERGELRAREAWGEKWDELQPRLESPSLDEVDKVLTKIANDKSLTPEQKVSAFEYGIYSLQYLTARGVENAFEGHKDALSGLLRDTYAEAYSAEPTGELALKASKEMMSAAQEVMDILHVENTETLDEMLENNSSELLAKGNEETVDAINEYKAAKARYEGIRDKFQDTREEQYRESDMGIDRMANNGSVYSTRYQGEDVFITGGNVALNDNGTIDFDKSSEALYVKYPDGRVKVVASENFADPVSVENAEEMKSVRRAEIDARWKAGFDNAETAANELQKRENGMLFEVTDKMGTHAIEVLEEGAEESKILFDGAEYDIPTEELNKWREEAGIVSQKETDEQLANSEDAQPVESVPEITPIPTEKVGKEERAAYHLVSIERTMEDLHDGTLEPDEIEGLIDARIKEAENDVKNVEKKKPVIGADKNAYVAAKQQWRADMEAVKAKLDYYNQLKAINAEATRSEMREAVEAVKPRDVVEKTADEFVASVMPKITPESFKKETGLKNSEQKALVGVIAGEGNGGVTIEQAAEIVLENYEDELRSLGFNGDVQDVRDMIINILSNGNPRSYAKKGAEMRAQQSVEEQMSQLEGIAIGMGFKDTNEMIAYEEAVLPRIIQDYTGFDETEYFNNLAGNIKYDTTRESEGTRGSSELLQGKQPADNAGATNLGEPGQGGEVQGDVYSGGENAAPQGNQQVNGSEIPNNQNRDNVSQVEGAAEGENAPGQNGVTSLAEHANGIAKKLGVNVTVHTDVSTVTNVDAMKAITEGGQVMGWYNPVTGEIALFLPNMKSERDVESTILHEAVSHYGIKKLLGKEQFNKFLDEVWKMMPEDAKVYYLDYVGAKKAPNVADMRAAADEYVAHIAERMDLNEVEKSIWNRIVDFVFDALKRLGFKNLQREDIEVVIRASYANLRQNGGNSQVTGQGETMASKKNYTAEEQEIIDRAKADGTYMKAPNGKPSKLSPKQWAQVRTEKFKKWFGDWEKVARIEKLKASKPVEITGQEIEASEDLKQYKQNALEYGKSLRGEYTNADTGASVQVNAQSIKEVLHHDYKDVEHLQSVAAIPLLIEQGVYIDTVANELKDANSKVREYQYYVCGLKIGGVDYTVKFVIAVDNNGNRYYDHKLTEIEKSKLLDELDRITSPSSQEENALSVVKDKRLISILQTNSSKIVDENGEPMVVYHRTPNEFTTFDPAMIGASTDAGAFGSGFYLSPADFGSLYGKNLMPLFVNLKNPLMLNNANAFDVKEPFFSEDYSWGKEQAENFSAWVKENGYDGVWYENNGRDEIVATEPNQMKSATENNGEFSAENNDIRFRVVDWDGFTPTDKPVTFDNFFEQTSAIFEEQEKRPGGKADYMSPSGSVYWYGEDEGGEFVIRESDHWSMDISNAEEREKFNSNPANSREIASCRWALEVDNSPQLYSEIKREDVRTVNYNSGSHSLTINFNNGRTTRRDNVSPYDMRTYFSLLKSEGNAKAVDYVVDLVNEKYHSKPSPKMRIGKAYLKDFTKWESENSKNSSSRTMLSKADAAQMLLERIEPFVKEKREEQTRFSKVFHGSGAKFDKFDHSFMGTGEGAQAFGWGTYVTEVEGIGRTYATTMRNKLISEKHKENAIINKLAKELLESVNGNKEEALDYLRGLLNESWSDKKRVKAEIKIIETGKFLPETKIKANLYTVEIPDDNGSNYLHWEKPINGEIQERVANGLQSIGFEIEPGMNHLAYSRDGKIAVLNINAKGKDLYAELSDALGGDKQASLFLNDMGFVGISYPANATTGGRADFARNYVIFNENDAVIEDRIMFRRANKNQEVFVSNAQRAVEGIKQEKATPEQWIAMLKKNGGLKAGEEAWLGLEEWLNEKQGAVTKKEILDFIGENKIQIEEVNYQGSEEDLNDSRGLIAKMRGEDFADEFLKAFDIEYGEFGIYDEEKAFELYKRENGTEAADEEEILAWAEGVMNEAQDNARPINSTRLDYTTEGLENKREIALTVPTVEPYNASDEVHFGDAGNGRAVAWVRFGEATADTDETIAAKKRVEEYLAEMREKYNAAEGEETDAMTAEEIKHLQGLTAKLVDSYDRKARVLVIDEIQSKRHQDGREKGYKSSEAQKLQQERDALYDKMYTSGLSVEEHNRFKELGELLADVSSDGVPAAPFEKNWHELAMKRMLRLAAEEGFDKVAWTTGEQQAERYNLGGAVQEIKVEKYPRGYEVVSYGHNGNIVHSDVFSTPEAMAEVYGKELAQKIVGTADSNEGKAVINGDGLRIGGEGMKGFYDRMLPSFVSKYTKKWGAKVGEVTMPNLRENNTMWSVDVTPEMQESVMEGQTMFSKKMEESTEYRRAVRTAEWFNSRHKGAAPVVVIRSEKALEEQLAEMDFSNKEIDDIIERHKKGGNAFYNIRRNVVVLLNTNLDKKQLKTILWHEAVHKVINDSGITDEQLDEFYSMQSEDGKARTEDLLRNTDYEESEYPEEYLAYYIQDLYWGNLINSSDYDILSRLKDGIAENDRKQFEFVQPIINNIVNGTSEIFEAGETGGRRGDERDDSSRDISGRSNSDGESHADDGNMLHNSSSGENGETADGTRFRISEEEGVSLDDVPTAPLTFMERITQSVLDASAENKDALEKRADALRMYGRDLTKVLSLMKAQKEYDRATVDTLIKLTRMYFKHAQLLGHVTPHEVSLILGTIHRATGKRDISKEANRLVELLVEAHTKELSSILDKAVKTKATKVNMSGVEVMGSLDKRGQIMTAAYKEALELDIEKIEKKMIDAEERMGDANPNRAKEAEAELAGLMLAHEYKTEVAEREQEIKDLKNEIKVAERDAREGAMDRKTLNEFRKETQDSIFESRLEIIDVYHNLIRQFSEGLRESSARAKAFRQAQIDRVKDIQHNANSDMEGKPADIQSKLPDRWNNSFMRTFMAPFGTFQQLLKKFGEKSVTGMGYLYQRFMPQVTKASDREFRKRTEARLKLNVKLSEIFGKKMRYADLLSLDRKMKGMTVQYINGAVYDPATEQMVPTYGKADLSQGQMLYLYMINKMADGRMKLRKMGITEEVMEEIKNNLDNHFILFADWVQDTFLKDKREEYNEVYERLFGAPMAAIEDYFPIKVQKRGLNETVDVAQQEMEKPSTITGSIIKRTRNASAIDLSANAFNVLMDHIDDMEHWAAFAELNRDINTLLSYKHFRNQVMNMTTVRYGSGKKLWENFENTARIVTQNYRPKSGDIDKAVVNLTKAVSASKINFRLYTAIKQILSAPAFWTEAGFTALVHAYTNPREAWNWAIDELPGFAERWQGRMAGNERLKPTDKDWKMWRNKWVEGASRWGMTPNAWVDAVVVSVGAKAVYDTKLEEFKNAGYSEEKAKEKALQAAAEAYNESQQSSEGAYMSAMQMDRTFLAATLTTFKNSNFGYTRKTAQSIANLNRKRKEGYKEESIAFMTKQMVREGLTEEQARAYAERIYKRSTYKDAANVAMYGFALNIFWALGGKAIYLLFGDDDEEKREMALEALGEGVLGPVMGVGAGDALINLAKAAYTGEWKNFSLPGLPAIADVENIAQLFEYDPVRGATELLNMFVAAGIGVNPAVFTELYAALADGGWSPEELGLIALRLMAAPQSQIDQLLVDRAVEDSGKNLEEIVKRYAEYKFNRSTPITQWAYSDEGEQKAMERYIKRFDKLIGERLEDVVADDTAYSMYYDNAEPELKAKLAKYREKYLAGEGEEGKEFEKLTVAEMVRNILFGKKPENEVYYAWATVEDVDEAYRIKNEISRHKKVNDAIKDLQGDALERYVLDNEKEIVLYKSLYAYNAATNRLMSAMKTEPEKAEEYMKAIREIREEAIKLINNYE